jgi:hypothetical protein
MALHLYCPHTIRSQHVTSRICKYVPNHRFLAVFFAIRWLFRFSKYLCSFVFILFFLFELPFLSKTPICVLVWDWQWLVAVIHWPQTQKIPYVTDAPYIELFLGCYKTRFALEHWSKYNIYIFISLYKEFWSSLNFNGKSFSTKL